MNGAELGARSRRPRMFTRTKLAVLALAMSLLSISAGAAGRATLTLENASGDDALVRVSGPTTGYVEVPNSSSRTINVTGGTYRLFVRYGQPGKFSYTRGEPFTIVDNGREW